MATNLAYGPYVFADNSVWFQISRTAEQSRTGRRMFINHVWDIYGRVGAPGDTPAQIDTKKSALEAALVDGNNLAFSLGTYSLLSSQCVNGTKVLKFDWLKGYDNAHGSGAEAILRRSFHLVIGGKIPATSDTDVIAYNETIRGIGSGGPTVKPVRSLAGTVQAQQTEAVTEFWAIQSGSSTGLLAYPPAASAVWAVTPGVFYVPEKTILGQQTPINFGVNINTGFTTTWSYTCWSTVQLVATPGVF